MWSRLILPLNALILVVATYHDPSQDRLAIPFACATAEEKGQACEYRHRHRGDRRRDFQPARHSITVFDGHERGLAARPYVQGIRGLALGYSKFRFPLWCGRHINAFDQTPGRLRFGATRQIDPTQTTQQG